MIEDSEKQQVSPMPPPPQVVKGEGSIRSRGLAIGATGMFEASPQTRVTLDLTPEAASPLNELMRQTGDTPSDLFRKALGLYALAERAKRQRKAVGIVTNREALETEFVGF